MCIENIAYYFYLQFDDLKYPLAVINLFSLPDMTLLSQSSQTIYLCDVLEGPDAIRVIPIVRATPKSNSVDNVRALQGDATVLETTIKL